MQNCDTIWKTNDQYAELKEITIGYGSEPIWRASGLGPLAPVHGQPVGDSDMKDLSQLRPGDRGQVAAVSGQGAIHQRLLEMGLVAGQEIEVVRFAPLGDPMEIVVCGYHLVLRKSEAALVEVAPLTEAAV